MRNNGRKLDELRKLDIEVNVLKNAHGSVLISTGNTKVLCTAMLEEGVPPFLAGTGSGWNIPCCPLQRRTAKNATVCGRTAGESRYSG